MKHPLSRRDFIKAGVAGLAGATGSAWRAGLPFQRPNVVLIICDQMTIDAISAYRTRFNHPAYLAHWLHTPNLDRMVKEGCSFTRSYAASPLCSPDRACLFTGRTALENGVVDNNHGISKKVPNLGEWLEQNTIYQRYYCGKWHAGGSWKCPTVTGNRKIPGFSTLPVDGIGFKLDPMISESVAAFLHHYNKAAPFLIVAGFLLPHDICFWNEPGKFLEQTNEFGLELPTLPPNMNVPYTEKWAERQIAPARFNDPIWRCYIHDYCRQVEMLDAELGRILDAVDAREDAQNTLVIFTSDHGEGAGRMSSLGKRAVFQYAQQVPLIFYCPGRVAPGVIDQTHLVSALDLMSTVSDYAGIPAPPRARGRSLRGIVEGLAPNVWRDFVYGEYGVTGRMICTNRYKYAYRYVYTGDIDFPYVKLNGQRSQWINGGADQFQAYPGAGLFDVEDDPWEMNNLIHDPEYAALAAELDQELRDYQNLLLQNDYFDRD